MASRQQAYPDDVNIIRIIQLLNWWTDFLQPFTNAIWHNVVSDIVKMVR